MGRPGRTWAPFSVNFQRNAEMAPSKFADASNEDLVEPLPLPMS